MVEPSSSGACVRQSLRCYEWYSSAWLGTGLWKSILTWDGTQSSGNECIRYEWTLREQRLVKNKRKLTHLLSSASSLLSGVTSSFFLLLQLCLWIKAAFLTHWWSLGLCLICFSQPSTHVTSFLLGVSAAMCILLACLLIFGPAWCTSPIAGH